MNGQDWVNMVIKKKDLIHLQNKKKCSFSKKKKMLTI